MFHAVAAILDPGRPTTKRRILNSYGKLEGNLISYICMADPSRQGGQGTLQGPSLGAGHIA